MGTKPQGIAVNRLLTTREVCRLIRRSPGWFTAHKAELEAHGFPSPVSVIGHYDEKAIERWIEQQWGQKVDDAGEPRSAWSARLRRVQQNHHAH